MNVYLSFLNNPYENNKRNTFLWASDIVCATTNIHNETTSPKFIEIINTLLISE